jgi:signal transduction histidine kinase
MFELQAKKQSISLHLEYASDSPVLINSDESRLKQVIINLLGNAFKFTLKGSITLRVRSISKR